MEINIYTTGSVYPALSRIPSALGEGMNLALSVFLKTKSKRVIIMFRLNNLFDQILKWSDLYGDSRAGIGTLGKI